MDKLVKISEIFNITLDELIKGKNNVESKVDTTNENNTNSEELAGNIIKIFLFGIMFLSKINQNIVSD